MLKENLQSEYIKERKKYYNSLGLSEVEVENMKAREKLVYQETVRRDRDIEKQNIACKIRAARYNRRYKELALEREPRYLRKYRKEVDIGIIAKLKCGDFENANKYWVNVEEKLCRLCKKEEETLEHIVVRCEDAKSFMEKLKENGTIRLGKFLNEKGNIRVAKAFKEFIKEVGKRDKRVNGEIVNV